MPVTRIACGRLDGRSAGRLAGWLVRWLAGWLAGCLAGWLAGRLAGWPAGWPAGWLAGWQGGWAADWLAGCRWMAVSGAKRVGNGPFGAFGTGNGIPEGARAIWTVFGSQNRPKPADPLAGQACNQNGVSDLLQFSYHGYKINTAIYFSVPLI